MKQRLLGTLASLLLAPLTVLYAVDAKMTAQPKGEPTNAKEADAKKQAAATAIDEKYAALVAALPQEEQAWERTLQENLGSFYLPLYKAGRVKGSQQAWDYVKDVPGLPRVLLIGDSVSRGYTLAARKALAGKANVHRAPENCGPSAWVRCGYSIGGANEGTCDRFGN